MTEKESLSLNLNQKESLQKESLKKESLKNKMSFLDNIKKGFLIGFGFSLSNNITNKLFHKLYNDPGYTCENILKNYDNCVKYENNNSCKDILMDFENCRMKKNYIRL